MTDRRSSEIVFYHMAEAAGMSPPAIRGAVDAIRADEREKEFQRFKRAAYICVERRIVDEIAWLRIMEARFRNPAVERGEHDKEDET